VSLTGSEKPSDCLRETLPLKSGSGAHQHLRHRKLRPNVEVVALLQPAAQPIGGDETALGGEETESFLALY
jgi:hypothetical protein